VHFGAHDDEPTSFIPLSFSNPLSELQGFFLFSEDRINICFVPQVDSSFEPKRLDKVVDVCLEVSYVFFRRF
jgi:hypothetical protein